MRAVRQRVGYCPQYDMQPICSDNTHTYSFTNLTTFAQMLTGDHDITPGDSFIDGHSVVRDMGAVRQRVGYCPQYDALFSLMTARETLEMYARLRGLHEREVKAAAQVCAPSVFVVFCMCLSVRCLCESCALLVFVLVEFCLCLSVCCACACVRLGRGGTSCE